MTTNPATAYQDLIAELDATSPDVRADAAAIAHEIAERLKGRAGKQLDALAAQASEGTNI